MTTAMPPVGPLTSTENLLPGDILRVINDVDADYPFASRGDLVTFATTSFTDVVFKGNHASWRPSRFAFVARPGVWMPWNGGENPVPGMKVRVRGIMGSNASPNALPSEDLCWSANFGGIPIREYMVVTDVPQPRKGDPVEPPFGCQPLPQGTESLADLINSGAVRPDYPGSKRLVPVEAHDDPSAQLEQKVIHFDPFTGKDGDCVRVTFSATLGSGPSKNGVVTSAILSNLKNKYPDLVVELLDRPLAVGDDVLIMGESRGKIVAFLSDGRAVCEYDAGDMTNVVARNPSCLTPA